MRVWRVWVYLVAMGAFSGASALAQTLATATTSTATDAWVGRPIAQMLDASIRAGVKLVYSSATVPADLRVISEPRAMRPLERIREVLKPHGLELRAMPAGTWVVAPIGTTPKTAPDTDRETLPHLRSGEALAEVTVLGSRYTLRANALSSPLGLSGQDLALQPALFEDPLRAIRRFPGTAGTTYSSRTHVRGGKDNENLILLDGVPLIDPFRRLGQPADLSLVDAALLDRVEFFPGVFPVEYGGRMSSVVRLESHRATRPFGGRLALGFVNASALLEGQLPDREGDWLVAARRSTLDLLAHAVEPDIGRPKLFDVFASAHQQVRPGWIGSAGLLKAFDEAETLERDGSESSELNADRLIGWLGLDGTIGASSVETRLAFNRNTIRRSGIIAEEDGADGDLVDRRHIRSLLLRQDGATPWGRTLWRWGWQVGAAEVAYDYRKAVHFTEDAVALYGVPAQESFALKADSGARDQAAYLSVQWTVAARLFAEVGWRGERHHYETGQTDARGDPRLSLLWKQGRSQWRLGWGQFSQFAEASELPVDRLRTTFDPPSHSALWVLGWDYTFDSDRLVRLEIYDRRVRNPWPHLESLINPLVVVPELHPDQVLIAPMRAHSQGLDLYVAGRLSARSQGWLSYSYSRSRDRFGASRAPRTWDQPHALMVGFSTDQWGWLWSATLTAHSGWPTTRVAVTAEDDIVLGSRNASRLGWYGTLDLKAQHAFAMPRGQLRFTAELTNATDRRNECCSSLEFATDEEPPKVDRDHWLPRLPLLSVAWEF